MKYIEMAKKVAKFLRTTESYKNGEVSFEPNTYDREEDMPHLNYDNGERVVVNSAEISEDGMEMFITFLHDAKDGCSGFCLSFYTDGDVTEDEMEKECEEMGLDEVLMEMFYYTNESYNYEDFEDMLNTIE